MSRKFYRTFTMGIERANPPRNSTVLAVALISRISRVFHHPLSPFTKRAFYSVVVLAIVMVIGTIGIGAIEGWDPVTSFYFMALLATAEGPAQAPVTAAGKIFASVMAFFSIGAAISAITFTFGPLFGSALKIGIQYVEKEEEKLKEKIEHKNSSKSDFQ